MQDCLALGREIRELCTLAPCETIEVISSAEPWSPIAAVCLRGCRMPAGIRPAQLDLWIPIPDLYGFATIASVVVLPAQLIEVREGEEVLVPFCEVLDPEACARYHPYFAYLRMGSPAVGWYLCLAPA